MKIILFISLFYASLTIAAPKPHLICLGKEEAYIHKNKIGGAYKKLNQDIISALIQFSDSIRMNPKSLKQVCSKTFVSLEILKLLIIEKNPIFHSKQTSKNIRQKSLDKLSLTELKEKSIHIFISFINSIQAQLKTPDCLKKKIPQLNDFFYKLRYTLEDIGEKEIIKSIKDPKKVFKKLHSLPMDKNC